MRHSVLIRFYLLVTSRLISYSILTCHPRLVARSLSTFPLFLLSNSHPIRFFLLRSGADRELWSAVRSAVRSALGSPPSRPAGRWWGPKNRAVPDMLITRTS
ncbi:hypothetical protein B0T20DRAFT_414533 [Sordaria brevicollis]|uniref:Uncharacterized protein n=1 Tax=Sordaria brevicollis TaxID=83679 RepID=A0AAE0UAB5_SORBR|nr:hypothetical protein B0T20DRAFT_414533 [Sordaria brevicollis]